MKKKNGFTLVELLVTIALMLTVLGIAIVSIIKISDTKKEESYRLVKDQIITAAQQYLETNAYYKEYLTDSNYIRISVGKLVMNDYLNAVTNPISGNKLDNCNYVEITKENGKLVYNFIDDATDCSDSAYVEVIEGGGPVINIEFEGKLGENNWYILDEDNNSPIVKITAYGTNSNIEGSIEAYLDEENKYISLETDFNLNDGQPIIHENNMYEYVATDTYNYSKTTNSNGKEICYKATDELGRSSRKCITKKVDVDSPTCDVKVYGIILETSVDSNNKIYYKYRQYGSLIKPLVNLKREDYGSGINEDKLFMLKSTDNGIFKKYEPFYQEDTNEKVITLEGKVYDNAGNQGYCSKNVMVEKFKVDSIIDIVNNSLPRTSCGETTGDSTKWTNKPRTISQTFITKSSLSEEEETVKEKTFSSSEKVSNITYNLTSCPVNVYVDTTAPKLNKVSFKNENKLRFVQKNTKGTVVKEELIEVKEDGDGDYIGYACLKNIDGKFNFYDYNYIAKDDDSGIKANSSNFYRETYSYGLMKYTNYSCRSTKKENPCLIEDFYYVYDNAGNKSENLGKIKIWVGYEGVEDFCGGTKNTSGWR